MLPLAAGELFAAPTQPPGRFDRQEVILNTGARPWGGVFEDFNRDGNLEFAAIVGNESTIENGSRLIVWQKRPNGKYLERYSEPLKSPGLAVASGDYDGDGWPDVATMRRTGLQIDYNDGRTGKETFTNRSFAIGPEFIADDMTVLEAEEDGKPASLFVFNSPSGPTKDNAFYTLLVGAARRGTVTSYPIDLPTQRHSAVEGADFTGDGTKDAFFLSDEKGNLGRGGTIYENDGLGNLSPYTHLELNLNWPMIVTDLNNNGRPDIVAGQGTVRVVEQEASDRTKFRVTGSFTDSSYASSYFHLDAADGTCDGGLDIFGTLTDGFDVNTLKPDGTWSQTFNKYAWNVLGPDRAVAGHSMDRAIAGSVDEDGDGALDKWVIDTSTNNVIVAYKRPCNDSTPEATITSQPTQVVTATEVISPSPTQEAINTSSPTHTEAATASSTATATSTPTVKAKEYWSFLPIAVVRENVR